MIRHFIHIDTVEQTYRLDAMFRKTAERHRSRRTGGKHRAHGLLQSLVVRREKSGAYAVVAGGRKARRPATPVLNRARSPKTS